MNFHQVLMRDKCRTVDAHTHIYLNFSPSMCKRNFPASLNFRHEFAVYKPVGVAVLSAGLNKSYGDRESDSNYATNTVKSIGI